MWRINKKRTKERNKEERRRKGNIQVRKHTGHNYITLDSWSENKK